MALLSNRAQVCNREILQFNNRLKYTSAAAFHAILPAQYDSEVTNARERYPTGNLRGLVSQK
ncbi:hypothetical protein GCM10010136_27520 [Limoniibacter endophyticus]|uniref:Uncharacterized protein n=1 Tax=Limoniibacter endophyticus TaxID=1565040 RepID=A0A8J3DS01_9HYPH|nr:hypothetical protein GCM10010136_27520 [Limoniibacter endophyticus]